MSVVLTRISGNGLWGQWETLSGPAVQAFENIEETVNSSGTTVLTPTGNTAYGVYNEGSPANIEVSQPVFAGQHIEIYNKGTSVLNTNTFTFTEPFTTTGNLTWTSDAPDQYIALIAFSAFNGTLDEVVWRLTDYSGGVLS